MELRSNKCKHTVILKMNICMGKRQRIPKRQYKMDNPEKLETYGTQNEDKKTKAQHNMCWAPLCTNKHK